MTQSAASDWTSEQQARVDARVRWWTPALRPLVEALYGDVADIDELVRNAQLRWPNEREPKAVPAAASIRADGSVETAAPSSVFPERFGLDPVAVAAEFAARDADIQKLSKQVRDLQASLEKDGVTMSEADRRNKERDLANLSRDLAERLRSATNELGEPLNSTVGGIRLVVSAVPEPATLGALLAGLGLLAALRRRQDR